MSEIYYSQEPSENENRTQQQELSLYYGDRPEHELAMFERVYQKLKPETALKASLAFGLAIRSSESQERIRAIQSSRKLARYACYITALGSTGNGVAVADSDIEIAILDPKGIIPRDFERTELNDVLDDAAEWFLSRGRHIKQDGLINKQGWTVEPDTSTLINQQSIRRALREKGNFLLVAEAFAYPTCGVLDDLHHLREAIVRKAKNSSLEADIFNKGMEYLTQGRLRHVDRVTTLLNLAKTALQEGKQPTIDPLLANLLQTEPIDIIIQRYFQDSTKSTTTLEEMSLLYPSKHKFSHIE